MASTTSVPTCVLDVVYHGTFSMPEPACSSYVPAPLSTLQMKETHTLKITDGETIR